MEQEEAEEFQGPWTSGSLVAEDREGSGDRVHVKEDGGGGRSLTPAPTDK